MLHTLLLGSASGETSVPLKPTLFKDVVATDPNLVFINYISHRGIVKGYPDGSFHPQAGLTRAEAAAILVKTSGLLTPPIIKPTFKDVPITHWAANQIAAASQAGYLKGFPDGTYKPEARLTRAQGIALVMRLGTQKERAVLPAIKDMNSQHWAAGDMATALALEMIGLSADSQNIYPDAEMSRGSLARALAILLTKDPGLNKVSLEGRTSAVNGPASLIRQGQTQEIKDQTIIKAGDIIKTGYNASLRINYPDGSSNLVEANSEITVKQSDGRRYIKEDGSPGIAVEFLNMSMDKGTMFGALAAKHQGGEENETVNPASGQSSSRFNRVAAINGFNSLAAADNTQAPWYKTAEQKKVKVKVDMPWGVAAIRGTFLKITVNQDGTCRVACLTGNAEVSGGGANAGAVSLTGGTSSAINAQDRGAESATGLTNQDKDAFGKAGDWLLETAYEQGKNQEAEIKAPVMELLVDVPTAPANQEQSEDKPTTLQVVVDALKTSGIEIKAETMQQLQQEIQKAVQENQQSQPSQQQSNNTTSSSTSDSGSSSSSTVAAVSYSTAGTYGPANTVTTLSNIFVNAADITLQNMNVTGNVTVNYPNAVLNNLVINGNLHLAAGIGEGHVTLQNVEVKGTTLVYGGGPNSIELIDCNLYTLTIDKENNSVRIVAKGNTTIGAVTLNSGASLIEENLTGTGFSSISINGTDIPSTATIILCGNFDHVTLNSPSLSLEVPIGRIGELTLGSTAAGSTINLAAGVNVTSLVANASANIYGSGTIQHATIEAGGVEFEKYPMQWVISGGVTFEISGQIISSNGANTRLSSLSISSGSLSPAFSPEIVNYTVSTGNEVSSTTITPTAEDSNATIKVNGNLVTSGGASGAILLHPGGNSITIEVTAADSSIRTYIITIDVALAVVNIANITGVPAPAAGVIPVSSITETSQYNGTVTWSPNDTPYQGVQAYTATITLTAKNGFTLNGISANYFNVAGATSVTNQANSGTIIAVFPLTQAIPLTIAAPALTASKTYDGTTTASVTPGALTGVLGSNDVTVTATANYGNAAAGSDKTITVVYALGGADAGKYIKPADFIVNTGLITGKQLSITDRALTTSKTYDGTNSAFVTPGTLSGVVGNDNVTVTAEANYDTPDAGASKTITVVYSLTGADAGNYIAPVNYIANNGIIQSVAVSLSTINGLTVPVTGQNPVSGITETDQYTGAVTWSPNDSPFLDTKTYTATIALTPKLNYTLNGVSANCFSVPGATSVTNVADSGTITAVFPETLSSDATVSSTVYASYNIDNINNIIASGTTTINTNLTVDAFLNNLSKHSQATWKVVVQGTTITTSTDFDAAVAKAGSATLIFGDKLAVKAGDGSIKVFAITVVLGNPVAGGGSQPPTPSNPYSAAGLKSPFSGFTWGLYKYWFYDGIDNPSYFVGFAFDQNNTIKQNYQINGARYPLGLSIDNTGSGSIVFSFDAYYSGVSSLTLPWSNFSIAQP